MKIKDIEPIKRLIELGSNISGGTTGSVLGFVLGGAEGAVVGGVTGAIITGVVKVLGDISHRSLSDREEIRIGAATLIAVEEIRKRIEKGEKLRDDNFFQNSKENVRSNAEEIFEGVLLKSKNEHEEKKIKIIANIFASVAFHSEVSTGEANHILQVAENITYRQLVLLSLFRRKAEIDDVSLANTFSQDSFSQNFNENNIPIIKDISALQEIYQLYNLGLVGLIDRDSTDSQIMVSHTYTALLTYDDVIPNKMHLTDLGKRYYSILNLSEVSKEDLKEVAITLSK